MPVDLNVVMKAIYEAAPQADHNGEPIPFEKISNVGFARIGRQTRAAIRAVIEGLMEPSEEAMNAWAALAVERIKRHATGNPDGLTPEEGAAQCFRAMLRAELRRLKGEKE